MEATASNLSAVADSCATGLPLVSTTGILMGLQLITKVYVPVSFVTPICTSRYACLPSGEMEAALTPPPHTSFTSVALDIMALPGVLMATILASSGSCITTAVHWPSATSASVTFTSALSGSHLTWASL